MPRLLGILLLLSTLTGSLLLAQEPKKEPELTKEEQAKLEAEAAVRSEVGIRHHHSGKLGEAENECFATPCISGTNSILNLTSLLAIPNW